MTSWGCGPGGSGGGGTPESDRADPATLAYVGGEACARCHAEEARLWRGSHHDLAMQPADSTTVLGRFDGAAFRHGDVTTTFSRRDGRYIVRTDGPDGKLADFMVRHVFGVAPLQQYLLELPGGRLQALSIAWDSRPEPDGGQRWFHLYPGERIGHGDELHWTGPQQNWNFMCADCHSTDLKRNYDPATRAYRTTWVEIDVSCEACHGPGSAHVAWAERHARSGAGARPARSRSGPRRAGLTVSFRDRKAGAWAIDAETGNARPLPGGPYTAEIETCAPCHSRRTQIADGFRPGARFLDHYLPELLDTMLYHADGQQREEVYVWGSFLQSRMYHAGVTCADCHDPHSGRLRADGNALCAPCHVPAKYDATSHHGHRPGYEGARCVACHMPEATYMVVDRRADHSIRIPRPDLTRSLGVPNACAGCHADRPARWAEEMVSRWSGAKATGGFQRYASAFAAKGGPVQADRERARVLRDATQPEIARASAAGAIAGAPGPEGAAAARDALADPSPWVRAMAVTAVAAAAGTGAETRDLMRHFAPFLGDTARVVRIEAARVLAPVPSAALTGEQRDAYDRAAEEYVASQRLHADRPEHRTNLGTFLAQRGKYAEAEAEFRAAIALLPVYVPAWANFADMRREQGRDREAEGILREGIARTATPASGASAALHHALGLTLVRLGRSEEALAELALAARLEPANATFAYVHSAGLHSAGRSAEALTAIERALRIHPENRDLLAAGATIARDAGERKRALHWAERLLAANPSDPGARRLVEDLRRPP